jgi:hypothetical protein
MLADGDGVRASDKFSVVALPCALADGVRVVMMMVLLLLLLLFTRVFFCVRDSRRDIACHSAR